MKILLRSSKNGRSSQCFGRRLAFFRRPALAQQIRVVTTFPDLADITRQVGKDLVTVDSLATGVEDPHGVPMKPSFVPRLNRADRPGADRSG